MTNTDLLNKRMDESGLKRSKIAETLGISREFMWLKIHNKYEFKASEIKTLCALLNIKSLRERERIFFAD